MPLDGTLGCRQVHAFARVARHCDGLQAVPFDGLQGSIETR